MRACKCTYFEILFRNILTRGNTVAASNSLKWKQVSSVSIQKFTSSLKSNLLSEQVLVTLLSSLCFSLPSVVDENTGSPKIVRWRTDGLQKPVLSPPAGNGLTPQMPMNLRAVGEKDFSD